jgi:hypothetical protein
MTWSGGPSADDLVFRADKDVPYLSHFVNGNFTHGVVTLHTGYLFRTEPGWHLMATGPANAAKDGIVPLTGIIETDWLPYPFTMNWQLTRPGSVRFEEGEPFCRVFPVKAQALDAVDPEVRDLSDDRELMLQYRAWREQRDDFMAKYRSGDALTIKKAWQKFYFEGKYPDGSTTHAPHAMKLEISEPRDSRAGQASEAASNPAIADIDAGRTRPRRP